MDLFGNENIDPKKIKASTKKAAAQEKKCSVYALYFITFTYIDTKKTIYDLEIKGNAIEKIFIAQAKKSYFNCTIDRIRKEFKATQETKTIYEK